MESQELANEAELVKWAKKDNAAFTLLYEHYLPKIYGYIFKRVGVAEVAEDITSQTFLKACAALPRYQPRDCPFGSWLYRIATNNLYDYYRSQARRPAVGLEQALELSSPAASPENAADSELAKERVRQALSALPEKYQKIIHLKYFAQLSNQEISQILGCTPNNVGVRLFRALKKLKNSYEKSLE